MRYRTGAVLGATLIAIIAAERAWTADPPPPPVAAPSAPPTLWSFLGIKQCAEKCKEHLVVHKEKKEEKAAIKAICGDPGLCLRRHFGPLCPCGCAACKKEKKPPVTPLADPANLQSPNPAIRAAAEIKAEEDLAPQKVKAIRYLATIACGCYPQVKPALLAALDDCTEEVRFEAAVALCRTSGNPCSVCNASTCCDPAVRDKLQDLAFGTDDQGCLKEPSVRVRQAAAQAFEMCELITPPDPELPPDEAPRELPELDVPPREGAPADREADATAATPVTIRIRGDEPDGSAAAGDLETFPTEALNAGHHANGSGGDVPQAFRPDAAQKLDMAPVPPDTAFDQETPEDVGPELPTPEDREPEPLPTDFAGAFGPAAGPQSAAPYMIGDFFGAGSCRTTIVRSFTFADLFRESAGAPPNTFYTVLPDGSGTRVALNDATSIGGNQQTFPIQDVNDASGRLGGPPLPPVPAGGTFLDGTTVGDFSPDNDAFLYTSRFNMAYQVLLPSPGNGGGVGRVKISDNTSPLPRDRLILEYSYFDNVPLYPGGVNVNRLTAGFEKTFFDGLASFELKAPMAATLDSDVTQDGATDLESGEFGNLSLTVKALLVRCPNWAVSAGLQVGVPTADDTRAVLADGTPLVVIRNDAVHLGPFLGALWTPDERLFTHGFLQFDVATLGNATFANLDGLGLTEVGRLNDASLLYVDWGIGYWSLRNACPDHLLTGLAWTGEVHWNGSLQDPDAVLAGPWSIGCGGGPGGAVGDRVNVFDVTLGAHLELRGNTLLTLAYAVPAAAGEDALFDGEFRLLVNHHFGPRARRMRAPF